MVQLWLLCATFPNYLCTERVVFPGTPAHAAQDQRAVTPPTRFTTTFEKTNLTHLRIIFFLAFLRFFIPMWSEILGVYRDGCRPGCVGLRCTWNALHAVATQRTWHTYTYENVYLAVCTYTPISILFDWTTYVIHNIYKQLLQLHWRSQPDSLSV